MRSEKLSFVWFLNYAYTLVRYFEGRRRKSLLLHLRFGEIMPAARSRVDVSETGLWVGDSASHSKLLLSATPPLADGSTEAYVLYTEAVRGNRLELWHEPFTHLVV
ncbi:hypothetical protein [Pyrobaculum sp.]|uniref:hypothetical protein n=1 Tax=Pyrobaculum sp. TaxID=2004705 RepID=UPI003D0B92EB